MTTESESVIYQAACLGEGYPIIERFTNPEADFFNQVTDLAGKVETSKLGQKVRQHYKMAEGALEDRLTVALTILGCHSKFEQEKEAVLAGAKATHALLSARSFLGLSNGSVIRQFKATVKEACKGKDYRAQDTFGISSVVTASILGVDKPAEKMIKAISEATGKPVNVLADHLTTHLNLIRRIDNTLVQTTSDPGRPVGLSASGKEMMALLRRAELPDEIHFLSIPSNIASPVRV